MCVFQRVNEVRRSIVSGEHTEINPSRTSYKGSPRQLSQQLGISIQEVLGAIEYAQLEPAENDSGQLEFELKPVLAAYLEQTRLRDAEQNNQIQSLLKACLDAYQDSVRQMIREENRVAYQIKDMTESRFLEVLGQVSLSLGRVEAFVMQAARLLSQLDMRLARSEQMMMPESTSVRAIEMQPHQQPLQTQQQSAQSQSQPQPTQLIQTSPPSQQPQQTQMQSPGSVPRVMSNSEHWREFETQVTRTFAANGQMADSAISDWLATAKSLLTLGSLELRLNGEHLLEQLRAALQDKTFTKLHASLPADESVLPAFENFQDWVRAERAQGHSAILLFLILIMNKGPQISWSGFVTTFVNEA